jgi:hypothetical protein
VIDNELRERVEALIDDDTEPDWPDVVARAGAVERRRLDARRIAGVVMLALLIAAVAALLPGRIGTGRRHVDVVAQALAAVSQGPVLHAVLQVPAGQTWFSPGHPQPTVDVLDLGSGQTRPVISQMELWYDPDRGLALQVDSVDGTVAWQSLQTPTANFDDRGHVEQSKAPAQIDPGLAAFLKGYKQALVDGTATDAGPGTVAGRAVEWLRFPPQSSESVPEEVAVDRATFAAVAMRAVCPQCTLTPPTYTIATLEGVARGAVDFAPPKAVNPHPVALYAGSYELGTLDGASGFLGHDVYWPGQSVAGLPFTGVQFDHPANYSTVPPTPGSMIASGRAVTLYYGALKPPKFDGAPGDSYLTIGETADIGFAFHGFNMEELSEDGRPLTLARTVVPPEGEAILTDIGVWVAQLRKGGLYIEIEGQTRDAVVAAAQALTATP